MVLGVPIKNGSLNVREFKKKKKPTCGHIWRLRLIKCTKKAQAHLLIQCQGFWVSKWYQVPPPALPPLHPVFLKAVLNTSTLFTSIPTNRGLPSNAWVQTVPRTVCWGAEVGGVHWSSAEQPVPGTQLYMFTVETYKGLTDLVSKLLSPKSTYNSALGQSIQGTVKTHVLAREQVKTDHGAKLAKWHTTSPMDLESDWIGSVVLYHRRKGLNYTSVKTTTMATAL